MTSGLDQVETQPVWLRLPGFTGHTLRENLGICWVCQANSQARQTRMLFQIKSLTQKHENS